MARLKLAHVALWTRDLEASAAFWRDHFGAELGARYQSRRREGFTSIFARLPEGLEIELMTGPWVAKGDVDEEREGWAHVAIALGSEDAVRQMAERCASEGLLISPPRMTGDGFYEAVVRSPDGILVEITV